MMGAKSTVKAVGASLNRDAIGFVLLLSAVAAVEAGHSVVMPFLPEMMERVSPGADGITRGRHVAALVTAFPIAACLTAPLWGWVSDRWRRWPLLLMGLFGFSVTLSFYSRAGLPELYILRLLSGMFAAAVVPTAFAMVADRSPDYVQRARRYIWLNALVFAGDLTGPLIGEVSMAVGGTSPFFAPAVLSAIIMLGVLLVPLRDIAGPRGNVRHLPTASAIAPLLLISATAAAGLTILHLTLALGLEARSLSRERLSLLFGLCGAAMLVAQLIAFTGHRITVSAVQLLRPILAVLAAALVGAIYAQTLLPLVAVFLLAGWSTATLKLLTSFLTSRASQEAQGSGLALQYAAVSASQAVASFATGWAAESEHMMLWLAAAAALAAMALPLKQRF